MVEAEGKGGDAWGDLEAGEALTCAGSLMGVVGMTLAVVLGMQLTLRKDQLSSQKEEQEAGQMHLLCSFFVGEKNMPRKFPSGVSHPSEKPGRGQGPRM